MIPNGIARAQIDLIVCFNIVIGPAILSLVGWYPLFTETMWTTIIIATVIKIPGVYPAKNIFPTGIFAIKAYKIKFVPGGITDLQLDDAAVTAAENGLENFLSFQELIFLIA